MTPQTRSFTKTASLAFATLLTAIAIVLAFAAPANAQDESASATIGGSGCNGDNVEVSVRSTQGESLLTENVAPEAGGAWIAPLKIPATGEPVIASATCFSGDVVLVNYSPISLRVQPGVAVGGVIELPVSPTEAVADSATTPEELPETGPFTVPFTGIALAMIAAGTGMAFVARNSEVAEREPEASNTAWTSSHWDHN